MEKQSFIIFFMLLGCAFSKTISNLKAQDIVWFPNPNGNGSLIPAKLTPAPGYIAADADLSQIHYLLFTKANEQMPQELITGQPDSINTIDPSLPLKFLVHGFGGDIDHAFPEDIRLEYAREESESYNVVLMNWTVLSASPDYFAAFANAKEASVHAAELLKYLVDQDKTSWDKVHIIGYSLGGQVVGQIGHHIQAYQGNPKVGRITALDPAMALFDYATIDERIDPDDAEFVDVIHTACNGILGWWEASGHIDWYPNGGRYQPGCGVDLTGSCAHARAPAMFAESIFSTTKFFGRKCDTYENFASGACDSNPTEEMGHNTLSTATGVYFLNSKSQSPYAEGPL